jgi:hypothetical protein
VAKIQFTDVNTKEIYTDLVTLYEVNLNAEDKGRALPEDLAILRSYLSIKTREDLCSFVNTYDTRFSRRLVTEYMHTILDDKLLLEIEGSEKFMTKLSEDLLLEEREEGRQEGLEEGRQEGRVEGRQEGRQEGRVEGRAEGEIARLIKLIHIKKAKMKTRVQIIEELELDEVEARILDHYDDYLYLLG